ncbi:MAG: FAD-binding domain-containing protein [Pseudomonadota bacterium]|nr:FAD-binding domain-containing protein [Pseudomonadota bacterium]
MRKQPTHFNTRQDLINHVAHLIEADNQSPVSTKLGGIHAAKEQLHAAHIKDYARSRNHLDGAVTQLSPYIRHGVLSLESVRRWALAQYPGKEIEKFLQELTWRHFWQAHYYKLGNNIWQDQEPYKTGWYAKDYCPTLPADIRDGSTGVAVIDHFAHTLVRDGYLHNHARMYLAAYIIHWRRISWQAGAQWFLEHLLDGDPASNNLSWQWVASTFSHKPYIFNLANVRKYAGNNLDTSSENNQILDASYEKLTQQLFPNL